MKQLPKSTLFRFVSLAVLVGAVGYSLWHFEYCGVWPRRTGREPSPPPPAIEARLNEIVTFNSDDLLRSLATPDQPPPEAATLTQILSFLSQRHGVEIHVTPEAAAILDPGEIRGDSWKITGMSVRDLIHFFIERECRLVVRPDRIEVVPAHHVYETRVHSLGPEFATLADAERFAKVFQQVRPLSGVWDAKAITQAVPGGLLVHHSPEVHRDIELAIQQFRLVFAQQQPDRAVRVWSNEAEIRRMEAKLDQRGDFHYDATPLFDFMADISRRFGVGLSANNAYFRRTPDLRVSLDLVDVPLRQALHGAVAPKRQRRIILNDEAYFGLRTEPAKPLRQAFWLYDVRDLVSKSPGRTIQDLISFLSVLPLDGSSELIELDSTTLLFRDRSNKHTEIEAFLAKLRERPQDSALTEHSRSQWLAAMLEKPVDVGFVDAPIAKVVQEISRQIGVAITCVEHREFVEDHEDPFGTPAELAVLTTIVANGQPARDVLNRLSVPHWSWYITNEGVVFTDREPVANRPMRLPRLLQSQSLIQRVIPDSDYYRQLFGNWLAIRGSQHTWEQIAKLADAVGSCDVSRDTRPLEFTFRHDERLRAALSHPEKLPIDKMPLDVFSEYLSRRFNLPRLKGAWQRRDIVVMNETEALPLGTALSRALDSAGYAFDIVGGDIRLRNRTEPSREVISRLYPVGDFTRREPALALPPLIDRRVDWLPVKGTAADHAEVEQYLQLRRDHRRSPLTQPRPLSRGGRQFMVIPVGHLLQQSATERQAYEKRWNMATDDWNWWSSWRNGEFIVPDLLQVQAEEAARAEFVVAMLGKMLSNSVASTVEVMDGQAIMIHDARRLFEREFVTSPLWFVLECVVDPFRAPAPILINDRLKPDTSDGYLIARLPYFTETELAAPPDRRLGHFGPRIITAYANPEATVTPAVAENFRRTARLLNLLGESSDLFEFGQADEQSRPAIARRLLSRLQTSQEVVERAAIAAALSHNPGVPVEVLRELAALLRAPIADDGLYFNLVMACANSGPTSRLLSATELSTPSTPVERALHEELATTLSRLLLEPSSPRRATAIAGLLAYGEPGRAALRKHLEDENVSPRDKEFIRDQIKD